MKDELCRDKKDWPIGMDFFVSVKPRVGKRYRGWVTAWNPDARVLSIRDERTSNTRATHPEFCTVVKPSDMSQAKKIGYKKTSEAASEAARRISKVRSGSGVKKK